ncbi:MAG TPA: cadherin repeat domain-containing protein, partial [Stellaceae bacterium]|nr:cadherin repeat domain-containing protein [Stellaceae bacterium]
MAITISNLTVSNNAPAGTTIGVLVTTDASGTVIPCNYMLTKGSIGYFAIAGNNLITAWNAPATPGHYSVRLRAIGASTIFSGSATFTVDVGIAAPPPPSIQINGSTGPVTVSAGATISATVANGPGNPGDWLGVYPVGAPTGTG